MKKLFIILTCLLFTANVSFAVITPVDYKEVVETAKKIQKLSAKNNADEISKYYSENYKSFDGFGKREAIEIANITNKMYPESKTKESIKKIETKDDFIKVFVEEITKIKLDVKDEDAKYAITDRVKGKMTSSAYYAMIFKKEEDGVWRIIGDEVFKESTEIRYGEAIKTPFSMEVPENIIPGSEYTVKTTVDVPDDRLVVGSIGHDKIVFPPKKYYDPYRPINKSGVLERILIANKEGINEYANSTFAFIAPQIAKTKEGEIKRAAISGMGISVKRVNVQRANHEG